jgi:hypothetical protein
MAETRTDISEETSRALSLDNFTKPTLDNVRGLERPMAAGPRDMLIGTDDLGNRIYRTMLGTTYTDKGPKLTPRGDPIPKYAEGGLVDQQTQFAFMDEGGMIDDGEEVEPSTGNEVPPGSTKEEVADDIDTDLPVGAYVVPADVLQYYGRKFFTDMIEKAKEEGAVSVEPKEKIKAKVSKGEITIPPGIVEHLGVAHFEKLRQKAKEGLAEMEANGRIGGDPEEDELPFSDEELESEDMEEDGAQGFAEGGLAWNSPQMTGLTNTGTETVTYVGPDGTKMPILFMNGQPIQQIPQGYVPEGQAKAQQQAFKSVRPTLGNSESSGGALNTMKQPAEISQWGVEDFERYANPQGVNALISKIPEVLGMGGGVLGTVMNFAYQQQSQQALKEVENRLAMTDLDEQSRTRLEAVKNTLSQRDQAEEPAGGGLFGGLMGGDGLLSKLFGGGTRTTSELPAQSPASAPRTAPRTTPATTPASNSEGTSRAPTASPRPQANPTRTSAPAQAPKNSTPAQKETYSSSGRNNSQQVSGDPRNGFAEGGLVKRRNKC